MYPKYNQMVSRDTVHDTVRRYYESLDDIFFSRKLGKVQQVQIISVTLSSPGPDTVKQLFFMFIVPL